MHLGEGGGRRGKGEGATAAVLVSPLATGGPLCPVLGIEASFEGQGQSGRQMTKENTGEMRSPLVGKELLQMSRQRQKALATRDHSRCREDVQKP